MNLSIGVSFDNVHSYNDLGVVLTDMKITPPEPRAHKIDIPGRDGSLDLSEALTGDIRFKDRIITLEFSMLGDSRDIQSAYTRVMNAIHGKRFEHIVFDSDGQYYYTGRVKATALSSEPLKGVITIQLIVDPYKQDWGDDWLWDPFSFEDGIVNEMYNLTVNGTLEVTFIGQRKKYIPRITCSNSMSVIYKGKTYSLRAGNNKITDIWFEQGENNLTFKGNGIISIENIGGSL